MGLPGVFGVRCRIDGPALTLVTRRLSQFLGQPPGHEDWMMAPGDAAGEKVAVKS
jgi:hypothetical protein